MESVEKRVCTVISSTHCGQDADVSSLQYDTRNMKRDEKQVWGKPAFLAFAHISVFDLCRSQPPYSSVPTFVIPFRNDGRRIVLFSNWIDRDIFSNFNTNKSSALSYHTYQFRVGYCSTYYIQYSEVQAQSVLWCVGLGSTPTSPLLSGTWYSEGFLLVTNVKCTSSGYCCYSALHNHEKSNLKKRILLVCLQPATEVQVLRRVRSPEYCAPSCKYWPTRYHR